MNISQRLHVRQSTPSFQRKTMRYAGRCGCRAKVSEAVLSLTMLAMLMLAASNAYAACPTLAMPTPQRWKFNTLQWTYSGALPTTGITAAVSAWNSDQSFTAIQASTGFVDIQMSDDSAAQGLGEIEIFNAGNSGPGQTPNACYLKPSLNCSGICFNNSLIENAIVKFNNNNIGGAASDWAPIWGVTVSTAVDLVVQKTMAHEVGHFFWLADIDAAANCTDPTIMSLDDGFYCAISNPTACDVSAVAGIYVGWSTVGGICSPCNTASSCN